MTAEAITRALGGHWHGGYGMARCPAHEDRSPSLSLADGEGGRLLVKCHAGCDGRAVLGELRSRGLLGDWREGRDRRDDMPAPRPRPKPADDDEGRIRRALAIWDEALDPRGTLAETYFNGRGLELGGDLAGEVIRFHPRLFIPKILRTRAEDAEPGPGVVCLMRDLRTDRPAGIHRTLLAADGQKRVRQRALLGRAAGAAIKLDGDDWVSIGLVVAEGIETGLTARALGYRPCWALGSAGAIGSLPVLPGIEGVTLIAENDANGANQRACEACSRRWLDADQATFAIVEPADPSCNDLNDLLREWKS